MSAQALAKDQANIESTAAEWVVRRGDPARTARDDEEFYAWLEVDPRHGEAYDALALVLEDIGQLRDVTELPQPRGRIWTSAWLPAAAVAATVLLGFVLLLHFRPVPGETLSTAIGETRSVTLRDGSVVTLAADSQIEVRVDAEHRHVELRRGEVFFEVAHDASRPFYVKAGGTMVRVLGTRFDVRRGAERVRVTVEEGRVEVRDAKALTLTSPALRVLVAGQTTEVQEKPLYLAIGAVPPPVESVAATSAGAWRKGRLMYDAAPLGDIVADINRYLAPGVRLATPETAELRVTAAFKITEIPAFLDAVAASVPVTVNRNTDGSYVLAAKAASH